MVCWTRDVKTFVGNTVINNLKKGNRINRGKLYEDALQLARSRPGFRPGEEEKVVAVAERELDELKRSNPDFGRHMESSIQDLEIITINLARAAETAVKGDTQMQTASVDAHEFGEAAVLAFKQVVETAGAGWTLAGLMPTVKTEVVRQMLELGVFVPEDRERVLTFLESTKAGIYGSTRDIFESLSEWYRHYSEFNPAEPQTGGAAVEAGGFDAASPAASHSHEGGSGS